MTSKAIPPSHSRSPKGVYDRLRGVSRRKAIMETGSWKAETTSVDIHSFSSMAGPSYNPPSNSDGWSGIQRKNVQSNRRTTSSVIQMPSLVVSLDKPKFQWIKGELIGKGSYGRVYMALNATTGDIMAVKQVELPTTASDRNDGRQAVIVQALKSESVTLRDLEHPNIVNYLGYEESPKFLSIFLEYIPGGTIRSCLRNHGKFCEQVTKFFTTQILNGLEYLHSKGILHRDLKAENILVEKSGICKISDFGISKKAEDVHDGRAFTGMQGTVFWMAPEILNNNKTGYNVKVDIWSVGCVVFEMWTGQRPWSGYEVITVMLKLYQHSLPPPLPNGVVLSNIAQDFRNCCFKKNPNERPPASKLRDHPYLTLPPGWKFHLSYIAGKSQNLSTRNSNCPLNKDLPLVPLDAQSYIPSSDRRQVSPESLHLIDSPRRDGPPLVFIAPLNNPIPALAPPSTDNFSSGGSSAPTGSESSRTSISHRRKKLIVSNPDPDASDVDAYAKRFHSRSQKPPPLPDIPPPQLRSLNVADTPSRGNLKRSPSRATLPPLPALLPSTIIASPLTSYASNVNLTAKLDGNNTIRRNGPTKGEPLSPQDSTKHFTSTQAYAHRVRTSVAAPLRRKSRTPELADQESNMNKVRSLDNLRSKKYSRTSFGGRYRSGASTSVVGSTESALRNEDSSPQVESLPSDRIQSMKPPHHNSESFSEYDVVLHMLHEASRPAHVAQTDSGSSSGSDDEYSQSLWSKPPAPKAGRPPSRPLPHEPTKGETPLAINRDAWARPFVEDVYENLEEFFSGHDLDKPVIESHEPPHSSSALAPISVALDDKSPRHGKKSIRRVAAEKRFKRSLSDPSHVNDSRRNTKLWGCHLEEVTTG